MADMTEKLHNVEARDAIPQKRRKLNESQKTGQRSSDSIANEISSYGEDKRLKTSKDRAVEGNKPLQISLLDDDENDKDIKVNSNSEMREVCYGRIQGAEILASKVPSPKPEAVSISEEFWPQVRIVLRRRLGENSHIIHAIDFTREVIGTVDRNTAIGLSPLLDSKYGIRTTSRVLTRVKKEDDLPPGSKTNARYGLDLNLFGPKKYALNIGRHLSQKNLWLRTPLFVEAGVELHNPHSTKPAIPQNFPKVSSYASYRQQGPARTTEEIRNDVIGMFDTLQRTENLAEMNPDSRIITKLLKHQKQGLYFMVNKEKLNSQVINGKISNTSLWKEVTTATRQKIYLNIITGQEECELPEQVLGGILADMMGLGKTLLSLSLVSKTLDIDAQRWAKLLPPVQEEIQELTLKRKGKIEEAKLLKTPLVLNAKTTLLVSPLSTISNWEDQIKQHIKPGSLSYYIYHGSNRIKDPRKLAEYDIVITTYGSVASEFSHRHKKKKGSYPLEEINWFRILLDEAHMIREQSTQQFKAICRLAANRRWAITGTPVQNRLDDLGALIAFLRIKPFDEKGGFAQYIMTPFKMCDPEILPKLRVLVDSITLRRLKDRIELPKRYDRIVKLDFSEEERLVYDIFAKNASDRVNVIVGQQSNTLSGKSYVHILQSILRLRLICAHGKDLLSQADLSIMNGLSIDSAIDLESNDENETSSLTQKQAYDMYNLMQETNVDICVSCAEKIGQGDTVDLDGDSKDDTIIGYMTPCYHIVCQICIQKYKSEMKDYAQGRPTIDCPICQQHIKLTYFPLNQSGINEEESKFLQTKSLSKQSRSFADYNGPHTKTKALLDDLNLSRRESELLPSEPPIKSVIFSGWTAHLDLIQLALDQYGFKYVRLDGKMSRSARSEALDKFRDDSSVLIILVSIMAGGLGLNLTTANKVYVMEPQYNPAAEAQAIDRVHRLGQMREVETTRYIMNDSFEEKMIALQEKKKKLASLSMDRDKAERIDKTEAARKRLEDLRSLFK